MQACPLPVLPVLRTVPVGVGSGVAPTDAGTNSAVARVARRDLVVHPIDSRSLSAVFSGAVRCLCMNSWSGFRVLRRES